MGQRRQCLRLLYFFHYPLTNPTGLLLAGKSYHTRYSRYGRLMNEWLSIVQNIVAPACGIPDYLNLVMILPLVVQLVSGGSGQTNQQ